MRTRIGKVTNIYPSTGKVKVMYEDEGSASLPLSMLTMNQEYSMPAVGDRVVTMHMENGSSKGFVLGTYYGGGMHPKANTGYRKDFGGGAYAICRSGAYLLSAGSVSIKGEKRVFVSSGGAALSFSNEGAFLVGADVIIGSAQTEDEEVSEVDPDVYLKITKDEAELKAVARINIDAETDISIKAQNIMVEAEEIMLKCSYGEMTAEELMKRLERIEDRLGLSHTV